MSSFSKIDLSGLPAPEVVEALDYEQILSEMIADLVTRDEAFSALVESDPAFKVLEVAAYRELKLRQRVNDAARAVLLAYATGADLDNLAAYVPLERKVVVEGDPDARPPVEDTMESDDEFRRRVQLAPEGFSVAGPDGAYIFHALSVSDVRDAAVESPSPGSVVVYVLGRDGDGAPGQDVLDAAAAAVSNADTRPLTDLVAVQAATIVEYSVDAILYVQAGPSPDSVKDAAEEALGEYVDARHVFGLGVAVSGIHAALHVSGVSRVALASPAVDISVASNEAAYCTSVNLSVVVA